jgi:hypothetical protein
MESVVIVTFKDEGDIDGQPIGPVVVRFSDGRTVPTGWRTLAEAEAFANGFALPLEIC